MFIFLNILFEIMIFQNCFLNSLPILTYVDEFLVLILILLSFRYLILIKDKKIVFLKQEKKIIICMCLFLLIGILGTLYNRIQMNKIAIIKDVIAVSKFLLCYCCTLIISRNIDKQKLLRKIAKRCNIYIFIIFIFSIINIFIDIGMGWDVRYGLRSYSFLYRHPTYLVVSMVTMLSIVIANQDMYTNRNKVKVIKIQAIIVLILTFRNKAFVIIFSYFIINILKPYITKIKIKHIILMGVIGIISSYEKIKEYLAWGITAARPALHIVGVDLAVKYFPLGSGFASFASSISGEYYSPIYREYGINTVLGLRMDDYSCIADSYWPYIYGQYGIIGLLIFILIILGIILALNKRYKNNKNGLMASFLLIIYVLIASSAEAIFTDATIVFIFIILATYLGENRIEI